MALLKKKIKKLRIARATKIHDPLDEPYYNLLSADAHKPKKSIV
jgi:hypothetical protein